MTSENDFQTALDARPRFSAQVVADGQWQMPQTAPPAPP